MTTAPTTWLDAYRRNADDAPKNNRGPACGLHYYAYGTSPEGGVIRAQQCPTWLAPVVIDRNAKLHNQRPVEPPVCTKHFVLDPGGMALMVTQVRRASFGAGHQRYPIEILLCHADAMFWHLDEIRRGRVKRHRRLYGGVPVVRFSGFHRMCVLPRADLPDVVDWLRDLQTDSQSLVAVQQEKLRDHVHFVQPAARGDA